LLLELWLDGSFVDQHDRDIVFHGVDAVAMGALQAFRILAVFERLLVGGANEDFQQVFGEHGGIVQRLKPIHHGGTEARRKPRLKIGDCRLQIEIRESSLRPVSIE
jgi:hypothetical protein